MSRSREEVKQILEDAFRAVFPKDTVDISDGYQENIHVVIVSRAFDKLNEKQKQDWLLQIINETKLTADEKRLISLTLPVSPAEIK